MKFSVIVSSYNQLDILKERVIPAYKNQTFKDFELIIADDGSSDGTEQFCQENGDIVNYFVTQPDEGYRLVEIYNKAAKVATGDYLIFSASDSYPKEDYLEHFAKVVSPDKMHNGIRVNVDEEGMVVGPDWRVDMVFFEIEGKDEVKIYHPRPWELMTLNTMCMPREAFEKMGGIHEGYKGYGKMDWDMAAWCHFNGISLWWCPQSIVNHIKHVEKEDTEANTALFKERLEGFKSKERKSQEKARLILQK